MFNKAKPGADAYTFSLGGMTAIASFAAVPVIANDRINRIRDERRKRDCNELGTHAWLHRSRPAPKGGCA
jgi:hypothetical protein